MLTCEVLRFRSPLMDDIRKNIFNVDEYVEAESVRMWEFVVTV